MIIVSYWHNPDDPMYDLIFHAQHDVNVQHPEPGEVFSAETRGGTKMYFSTLPDEIVSQINIKSCMLI